MRSTVEVSVQAGWNLSVTPDEIFLENSDNWNPGL
jgi:hypothetical protein